MNKYRKFDNKNLELPKFDPSPSGKFACSVLREVGVRGTLIGRLAIWAWVEDSSRHNFTKDLDIAISRRDERKLLAYLSDYKDLRVRQLSIGGFNISDEANNIKVDFIHRLSLEWGDLSHLYEEAIREAAKLDHVVTIGGSPLLLVPVEYLLTMKLATAERKDEDDVKSLLENVESLEVDKVRDLVCRHIGPLWKAKFENLLREAGHPKAVMRKNYTS